MSGAEFPDQHPVWEGAIVGFLFAAESGLVDRDHIIPAMSQICVELLQQGMIDNYGILQTYLRLRGSRIQLVAEPFDSSEMPHEGVGCVDIMTGEPKGHYLLVSVSGTGGSEVDEHLRQLLMSSDVNEATLARDTGFLTTVGI